MSPAKKTVKAKKVAPARKVSAPKPPVAKPARVRAVAPPAREANDTVRLVRELAAIVERRQLTELILDANELTVTMRRGESAPAGPTFVTAAPAPIAAPIIEASAPAAVSAPVTVDEAPDEVVDDKLHVVTSPFVGTFYRRPNPDADAYAEVGARVDKGTVLCIVEAMKLMNEIEADITGTIVEILVSDAEPVEYGQPLFKIDPA